MSQDNVAAARVTVTRRLPRRGTLICLLGIDGSGKSTQAAVLVRSLREQDIPAIHTWVRWKPILMLPVRFLGRILVRRRGAGSQTHDYEGFTESKREILRGRLQATLWKHLTLLEHAIQVFFKVRIPMAMGRTVVADRYVYDTLIDLSVNLDREPTELLKEPLLRLFPVPNLSILLDVNPRVGAERKSDGTPEAYLVERRALYRSLSDTLGMEEVDAERSPMEVETEIRRRIWKRMGF